MKINDGFLARLNALLAEHPGSIVRLCSTDAHNAAVGGAPHSAHTVQNVTGEVCAGDLIFDSYDELELAAQAAIKLGFHGVELDETNRHLHVDTLPRTWHVRHVGPGQEAPLNLKSPERRPP